MKEFPYTQWNWITEPGYWRQEGQDTQSASSLREQSFYTAYHSSGPSDKAGLWNPAFLAETSRADSHQCSSIFQWVRCEWLIERERKKCPSTQGRCGLDQNNLQIFQFHTLLKIKVLHDAIEQGCQTQFLEGRSPTEFSSNPAPTHKPWSFQISLNDMISWIRCV